MSTILKTLMNSPVPSRHKFQGHEDLGDFGLRMTGMGARCYNQSIGRMMAHDAYSSAAPGLSGYRAFLNNPVSVTDPTGNYEISDGYSDISGSGALAVEYWGPSITEGSLNNDEYIYKPDDWVEDKNGNIYWDQNATSQATTKAGETYLGEVFIDFKGSTSEQLGPNGKLNEPGAVAAQVKVYGPNGPGDIQTYDGLSVSSDPTKYSMIKNGFYNAKYSPMASSLYGDNATTKRRGIQGALTYSISQNGSTNLTPAGGVNINKSSRNYGTGVINEIFLHRTNWNGKATNSSQGCLNICGTQWRRFESQVGKSSNIGIRLTR